MSKSNKTLRMHKHLGVPWHTDSGLVFKSKAEMVVTGRMEGNDFVEMDDKTVELAEKWKFKLDPSLITQDNTSEEDADNFEEAQPHHEEDADNFEEAQSQEEDADNHEEDVQQNNNDFTELQTTLSIGLKDVFTLLSDMKGENDKLKSENEDLQTRVTKAEKRVRVLTNALQELN